ncbi:MAG: hypothetical protein DWQ37_01780 [Planctomycetota bacterium]|nr:MAG: hypothetical protein DWQ37_01780 [Planctomycetota bacterium]
MNSELYLNPVGGYALAGAAAAALVLLLIYLGLPRHRLTPRRRWTLFGLRLLVIALALFAMLRPAVVYTESKPQSASLVLLVDDSRSMVVADAVGGRSRWDMLQSAVDEALPVLESISDDFEVKVYSFDSGLHALELAGDQLDLPLVPSGEQTAIGAALDDVLRREAGKRLVGVLLLSDGAQRAYAPRDVAPQGPARRLADLGFPLYTFAFGQARGLGQARDVSLADLAVNQTVYVKNELTARATARIEGFGSQSVPVQLLFENPAGEMELAEAQEISTTSGGGASVPIELSTIPQTPGEYKVTLRVPNQSGELVTTNNELSTFVTVLKGGINVLYLEGALRVDQVYLRRSLDASQDIKVDFVRLDPRDTKQRPADLIERFMPGKYDVYMLGDVDSSQLSEAELAALAEAVRAGAGLVMLGGFHTFGPGGYATTPLSNLLPVEMDRRARQPLGDPIRSDVQLSGPLKMRPTTPLGERHYLMQLNEGPDRGSIWQKLAPLEGANRLGAPKPGAQVLAETEAGQPLLVVGEAGGRVMAFAGDTTWHWWMEGFPNEHKRFWRQVILWLARKDELTDGNVWVKLQERRYRRGSRVEFTAGAQSPQGESVADARFTAEVTLPDGTTQKLNLVRQGDHVVGSYDGTQTAGDYAISVKAEDPSGGSLGTARSRFLVFEQDLELDNAAADPTLLASLAAMTKPVGGRALAPEELPALLKEIESRPVKMEVVSQVKLTPWDTWPFFLLFVGVISAEWYLRKKRGLV